MSFVQQIETAIADLHLLSHPFYRAWTAGELTQDQLRHYAVQYKPFVEAFPRFVSALHSQCEDSAARAEILENLMDEEGRTGHSAPHPQLWQDFADRLGAEIEPAQSYGVAALASKETFLKFCRSSYAEGLCALYAYEYQTPQISKSKIDGLKTFYGIDDARALEFFRVHEVADIYHSQSCGKLIDAIPVEQQPAALQAARTAAQSLWDFLSEAYGEAMAA
jgi:pyrroloquinoline-quinone synthase